MAFVNLSLLAGGLFVAIPVVLHLIMRQRPKPMVFPALRFIQQRRIANQRRLQLRHWLLLALRCGAIGLVALALARPSVASAAMSSWITAGLLAAGTLTALLLSVAAFSRGLPKYAAGGFAVVAALFLLATLFVGGRALAGRSPIMGDQEAPVAAVLVIDTSPRMQYRHENKTRLEAAQEMAQWLIKQLPADSEIAVADSRPGSGAFAVDRAAAANSIERLRPAGTPRPLVEVLESSVALVKEKSQSRKEIYVLTDLTQSAWKAPAASDLAGVLKENDNVLLYVIDVGVLQPQNFALEGLTLPSDLLPAGAELAIETQAAASGVGGERTVELQLEVPDPTLPIIRDGKPVLPKSVRRGSQTVKLDAGESQRVRFSILGLEPGVHQGLVRLLGEDGLALDDVRYFAVEVQPAWPVLIVTPPDVSPRYLVEALAPRELRETGQARFRCETIEQSRLASQELGDFRAVALLDPQPLTPDAWNKLAEFAERGGGVAIFLGHNAQPPSSFQDPAAVKVLGGKLTRQTRTAGDVYLAPQSYDHPALGVFRQLETSIPWDRFPVHYHWNLDELSPDARTIVPYSNGKPAVVENRLGRGSVLAMTTPISDPPRPAGYAAWNELATGEDAWPCFVLVNEMLVHLVKSGQTRLNLLAGETAVLPNDPAEFPERYQLFTPLDQPQDVLARDGRVTIRFTDNPGAYRLRGQKPGVGPIVRGFAVNLPADSSDLSRLPREKLDELLGKGRYQLARSREEIDRAVGNDRIGSEFYPLLAVLLVVTLGLEHVLANRFYRKEE
ncbi:MAG TPA: BatA domain-containing protein [Pirellulaceae bacterium]|nr:BatA domain-containing protein [Pirellulaceae bacterium]